ncbi:malonyl-CoA decarboxylase domain-containing protein [Aquabacterium sp.]|uniref:malonyl-CoA decarboxylase domain-containing protein n=1 Tax=Aquabacterium sp. TaxID=1872578 RepID=UPI002BC5CB21|nr:malonyl-CoA decarboxylase family protein [Aquabacterium sp.]HSW05961.1 malonyl-CoA decarboxylase family protein [Aquabacterium sp.]
MPPEAAPRAARAAPRKPGSRKVASPHERALRTLLADCRRLISERGDAGDPRIAQALVAQIDGLADEPRRRFFEHLARDFGPDPQQVLACAQAFAEAPDQAEHLIRLTQAAEPPRQELFRRLNRAPGGTAALVRLRRSLLERLPRQRGLAGVEHDLHHLLSSWFNPGFLQMRKVDWTSPAQLLEQIIRHEAVHAIDGWDDLRRRLQPDRRCFAFFHPQLPDEPLIFVEVALVPEMAAAIAPLIDKKSQPLPPEDFQVAVFYSISNCQPGLRGVSLGNFLIKRVAEQLKRELPQLKTFCTLSPIPGFMDWLQRMHGDAEAAVMAASPSEVLRMAARFLVHESVRPQGDPVARFHLDNGARLERLNPQANLSAKGLKQSAGLMVNYLYDLARIETCHDRFVQGRVVHSRAVAALL